MPHETPPKTAPSAPKPIAPNASDSPPSSTTSSLVFDACYMEIGKAAVKICGNRMNLAFIERVAGSIRALVAELANHSQKPPAITIDYRSLPLR